MYYNERMFNSCVCEVQKLTFGLTKNNSALYGMFHNHAQEPSTVIQEEVYV